MTVIRMSASFDSIAEATEFVDAMSAKHGLSLWIYRHEYEGEPQDEWHVACIEWNESECVYSRIIAEPITQDLFTETA